MCCISLCVNTTLITCCLAALFARQFVDMKRGRVEGLLAAFPKLVGSAGSSQHTYVETDAVRCVFAFEVKWYERWSQVLSKVLWFSVVSGMCTTLSTRFTLC